MNSTRPWRARKSAFTLIELLVVIAIIALIAAILFPVFASAREKARQTTCLSNMKQIGLANDQYISDNDECWFTDPTQLGGILLPYVKTEQVYSCPDDNNPGVSSNNALSYAANDGLFLTNANTKTAANQPRLNSDFTSTSLTVFLFESSGNLGPSAYTTGSTIGKPRTVWGYCEFGGYYECSLRGTGISPAAYADTGQMGGTCTAPQLPLYTSSSSSDCTGVLDPKYPNGRHNGGSIFLMADGHAKWLIGQAVSAGGPANTSNSPYTSGNFEADGTNALHPNIQVTFSYR